VSLHTRAVLLWLLFQAHQIVRRLPCSTAPRPRLRWRLGTPGITPVIDCESYTMRLTNEQAVTARIVLLTAGGNPAQPDGPATWTSSDPAVATVTPDPTDSTRATVQGIAPGVAQITVTVDADLSEGVRPLTASGAVEVVPAEAQTLELVFGDVALAMKKTDLV
jgi:hypothetical protein